MNRKARILVVESETSVAMTMVSLLTRAGCEVQSAWNVERALQLAQGGSFDLITLDVTMPGMNGFELCRRLKQNAHLRETPVVFVSGLLDETHRQRAFEAGAVDFIVKPFEATDFIYRIISHARTTTRAACEPTTNNATA
jgi:putative two-component system response regulator